MLFCYFVIINFYKNYVITGALLVIIIILFN